MDQLIATVSVILVLLAGVFAIAEPVSNILRLTFIYLKNIFLGPIKIEKQDEEQQR